MGKASRRKREARKNFSGISSHHRTGKTFTPPMMQIPNWQHSSWHNDRLPEMLWTVLIAGNVERETTIAEFRNAVDHIFNLDKEEKFSDVSHSGIAKLPVEKRESFIEKITKNQDVKMALAPLLFFPDLPALDSWKKFLKEPESQEAGWKLLANAVLKTLDHQSQESTDCRWVRVVSMLVADRLKLPTEELAREIVEYPDYGDMRKVRPSVRSAELMFQLEESLWPSQFWDFCMKNSLCIPFSNVEKSEEPEIGYSVNSIATAWTDLQIYFFETMETTNLNPKHDAVFSMSLYVVRIAAEVLRHKAKNLVMSRLALRTIVEIYITMAYLHKLNDDKLWHSYRRFSSGQAKLAFLKIVESDSETSSINLDELERLVNEDAWMEFVSIDVGHWEKTNLRKMSEKAGIKDVYDNYYAWTSNFSHGHWGALRLTVFDTCGNPLHRLHRIPKEKPSSLGTVVPDIARICDKILAIVSEIYPGKKFQISEKAAPPSSESELKQNDNSSETT